MNFDRIFEANDGLTVYVNQAEREATVLAVIDDEILIEYEMPAGTSALLKFNVSPGGELRNQVNYSYHKVPQKWTMAILEAGMTNWIGRGQRSHVRIPFPADY